MNRKIKSFLLRVLRGEGAQVLPMAAIAMVMFCGMAAMTIDVGDVYYAYNQLQASTQAAALAGAAAIAFPSLGSPTTVAEQYGAEAGEYKGVAVANSFPIFASATMTPPVPQCVTALTVAPYSISCITYTGESGTTGANAIQVTQTATVKTYFAALFGHPTVTLTSTASAARAGAPAIPANVAIIVDTTESMTTSDTNCIASKSTGKNGKTTYTYYSRIQCALQGVQVLLQNMAPCYSDESTCGTATNGFASPSVDRVALFTFPNLYATSANVAEDTTCPTANPSIQPYSFPAQPSTSNTTFYTSTTVPTTGVAATYEVTSGLGNADNNGFVNDYKTEDGTLSLNASSALSIAVGGGSCNGVQAPGGTGTYYAGAIYAAATALAAEKYNNPGSQNVLILVSDGDASSTGNMTSSAKCTKGGTASGCSCNTSGCVGTVSNAAKMASASTSSGTYPSTVNECQQAVQAAQNVYNKGNGIVDKLYSVAYGAESSGCSTDTKSSSYTNPCSTMKAIASSSNYYYADNNESGATGVCSGAVATGSLNQIFQDIASDFLRSRLIPNSVIPTS